MWSKLQLCQLEIPIFIHKLMCQGSLINTLSFVFCEFSRVASWKEGKNHFRIFVEKWNIYETQICQRSLLQTCSLETIFRLHNRLGVNKNFQFLIIFIEINVNVCLLCVHHVMTSIILHTPRSNCKKKVCYALGFMFHLIFFRILGAEKHVFHIAPFRPTRYVLKSFRYLDVTNPVRNRNKVKNVVYVGSKLQFCQLEIPIFIYKLMWQSSLIHLVSFLFCEFNRVAGWNDGKTINLVRSSIQIPK